MKIALIGYGKMGKAIERIALQRGHQIVSIIDINNADDIYSEAFRGADVAIEFTTPATALGNYMKCFEVGVPVVSGTTGWLDHLDEVKAKCENEGKTFFYASNYSLGVNLMFRLNRQLAALVNRVGGYEVSIEEVHHTQKKDAPSGTAITLAEGIIAELGTKHGWVNDAPAAADQIEIHSVREGTTPGIHTVTYESEDDRIELRHTIKNRRTLALGAVVAAEFLCGRRGVYSMEDLLK